MSSSADDLPWPELGNVSRGATRGNQGQKGVLGEIEPDGCSVLQLRVQPGVLTVRLNHQTTEWYKALDNEVNRALKLTKTYWRKARRRQDYDARADQDHMELHEWLQQLKDKTMSHLELLMQKGDIQGPPYIMPDDLELTFLRKFIERQAAGIPHNPRLRNTLATDVTYALRDPSLSSVSPEPDDLYDSHRGSVVDTPDQSVLLPPRNSGSPSLRTPESLAHEANTSKQTLALSRAALSRAQKETQEAFLRYTACLDAERQARQIVVAAEKRRDDIMTGLLAMNQSFLTFPEQQSRQAAVAMERYHTENDMKHRTKTLDWADHDTQNVFATAETVAHLEDPNRVLAHRKHSRTWDNTGLEGPYCEDLMPQRKRIHLMPGYDVLTPVLQAQNLGLQS